MSSLGQVFKDLKLKLATQFIQASVVQVSHECNKPTHVLAAFDTGLAADISNQWFSNYTDDVNRDVTGHLAVS